MPSIFHCLCIIITIIYILCKITSTLASIIVRCDFKPQKFNHCRSPVICRDDLELIWRLLMCENELSHISLLLYISTAFELSLSESEV